MTGWRLPELDDAAADALAVLTLYVGGRPDDTGLAADLLDQLAAAPDGTERLVGGFVSVAGALLVLLEHRGGVPPAEALDHVGRLVLHVAQDGRL
jgi:hypothetical protein